MDEETYNALLEYLLGGGGDGFAPSLSPASFQTAWGQVPQDLDKYGNTVPWGLDQENVASTLLGKRNRMQVDPVVAAQAGAAAFGPEAFTPQVDMQPVSRPGQQMLDYYKSRQQNTIEWIIANELDSGGSANSAMAKIRGIVEGKPDPNDTEAVTLQQAVIAQLPSIMTEDARGVKVPTPDFSSVQKMGQDLEKGLATDPVANFIDENGQAFLRNETPAPMTKWFQEMGLPLPTDEYTLDYLKGPEWSQQTTEMGVLGALPVQQARAEQSQATKREKETSGAMARYLADRAQYSAQMDKFNEVDPNQSRGLALAGLNPGGYVPTPGRAAQGAVQGGTNPMPVAPERPNIRVGGPLGGLNMPVSMEAVEAAQGTLGKKRKNYQKQQAEYRAMLDQVFGPDVFAQAGAAAGARRAGRNPLQDALMQRRMATVAAGLAGGTVPPGA